MPDETAYLDVRGPDGAASRFALQKWEVLLGRGAACDLNLHDTTVSREHARMIFRDLRWTLRDLNSENHTFLNGRPVRQAALAAGDEIAIGPYRLKFFCSGAKADIAKPGGPVRRTELSTRIIVLGPKVPAKLQKAAAQNTAVVVEPISASGPLQRIVGCSPHIQAVKQFIQRAAPSDAPVLIRGETGTGKELVAQALAALNPRRKPIAIAIDVGSIDAGLAAAELFGHEQGAFTGADRERTGKIQLADRATLFLDEIGRASPDVQNKLLRVLETGEFEPLGSRHTRKVDVRLVAATDTDLESLIRRGQFLDALYYRLKGLELRLLPLRERREDIPVLAEHFLAQLRQAPGARSFALTHDALVMLCTYAWPGNVRELKRCIESAAAMAETDVLGPSNFPEDIRGGSGESPDTLSDNAFKAARRALLVRALRQTGGNQNQAAVILGISRQAVHQMIQRYHVSDTEWRAS